MGISGGVTHRTEQQPRGGQPGDLHGPVAAFPLPSRKPERKPQRCPNPGPSAPSVPSGEIRIQPKAARRDFCLLFPFSREKGQRRNHSVLPLHHPPPPAASSSLRPGAPNPKTHQNHEKRAREAEMTELQVLERAVSWQCPGGALQVPLGSPCHTAHTLTSTRSCLLHSTLLRNTKKQASESRNPSKNASVAH